MLHTFYTFILVSPFHSAKAGVGIEAASTSQCMGSIRDQPHGALANGPHTH